MKAIFVQDGAAIDYTPSANVAAGDVVVIGTICAVAKLDIPANTLGAVATKGVFDIAKGTTAGITLGAALYWDATNKVATTTATSNTALGVAIAAADTAATTVRVLIK